MVPYQTKTKKLSGTSYSEVRSQAMFIFYQIRKRTKRRPYLRSAYFGKQKIFFDYFWHHLDQKNPRDRFNRLKYFEAAIEVIKHSRYEPVSKQNPNKSAEILHRFAGMTKQKELFYIQIKENKKNGKKYFMSCYSPE